MLGVDNSGDRSFIARARQTQSDLWNDLEHHDVSGVQVLREITRAKGRATSAKMPVVFTSALVVPVPEPNPDFPLTVVNGITQSSQVWLDCGIWEQEGALLCNWDVVLEVYPEGMIQEMFAAYWNLIRRLADEDDIWNQQVIDLLPPATHELVRSANETVADVSDETLVSLFLRRMSDTPHATAVITPEYELSYETLGLHAAYVQQKLTEHGIGKNQLVGIVMEKGWEQIAAAVGILAAGAAYLPIDPSLPEQRIRYLLEHGEVTQVVTQPWVAPKLASVTSAVVHAIDDTCMHPCASLGQTLPGPQDLAYVIFTSGSTGLPKGVMIDHRGAVNTVLDVNRRFAVGNGDRVLAVSALNFDLSVYDIFGLLAAGGAVVIPEHDRRLDPTHWLRLVQSCGVTIWNSVPALVKLFVDYASASGVQLPALREVMMSGDWIPVALADRIRLVAPQVRITSLGGATEASIWSILYPIETVDPSWASIPYGKAMDNQSFYVLNHALEQCPVWVTGELYIGGIGLALGYWRDPLKTNDAFITHPRTGERLYRTGDLGRLLPDGNIEFLGRADFQVKVQGHRIELGEIEAALTQHPSIHEAVVAALGGAMTDKYLSAYYVVRPGMTCEHAELRGYLLERLPEYMIPRVYQQLDAIPLSANGKVDRNALPQISFTSGPQAVKVFVAPRNDGEEKLAAIWRQVLNLETVGVYDDFFEVGGDSMAAIRLLTALRTELQADVHLRDIFDTPRIADLAARLFGTDALAHDQQAAAA
jgi:amino acid adenylation domain-containing protein